MKVVKYMQKTEVGPLGTPPPPFGNLSDNMFPRRSSQKHRFFKDYFPNRLQKNFPASKINESPKLITSFTA